MYCPNCKEEFPGKFCPECGTKLVEKPSAGMNIGDGNAFNGPLTYDASSKVHKEDNSVNIDNSSKVNNYNYIKEAEKSDMQILQEKREEYFKACQLALEDNALTQSESNVLIELSAKLGLHKSDTDELFEKARRLSQSKMRKTELPMIFRGKLNALSEALKKNEVASLMRQIDSFEGLANKISNDELHYKYYVVLAALKPESCVRKYETSKVDNYWLSFWSCLAYCKLGQENKANDILLYIEDKFSEAPSDNVAILSAAYACITGDYETATDCMNGICGEYSESLEYLVYALNILLDPSSAEHMGVTEQDCAFYLVNFFGKKVLSEADLEAERLERLRLEEEEKKRQEAERLERLRLEEEARRKEEAERLERLRLEEEERKRQEEQRLRSQVNYTLSIIACNNLLKGMMVTHNVLGWTSSDARKNLSKLPVLAAESDDMEMLKIIAEELLSAGMQVRLEGVNGLGEVQNIQLTTSKTTKAETKDASIYYDVVLVDAGCAKLQLIKVVREACGLGLKEAKEMIDGTPSTLKEGMSKADADALKRTLEEAGAEVDLRQAK